MIKLYPWQDDAIRKWLATCTDRKTIYGAKGIIKAVTGAGKSLVGKEIVQKFKLADDERIIVTCYSNTILDQWKIILDEFKNIEYITHQKLCKSESTDYPFKIRLLIIDEVHRSVSEEFIKIYDVVKYDNVLGLSATPNEESIQKCGETLVDIGFDQATVSPFYVHFHGIKLTGKEEMDYKSLSYAIGQCYRDNRNIKKNDKQVEGLIFKRRAIVYNANNRMSKTMAIIVKEYILGKKIVVFTQRIEQANKLAERLPLQSIVYHSDNKGDLEKYRTGKVKVLITVGMAREGFNDVDTDCGIIMATTLSESFHIQTIGRIIRFKPGKMATIHILLANNTSDMEVLKYTDNYDFELHDIKLPEKIDQELYDKYYSGQKYSFCENRLWKKDETGMGRTSYKLHPILKELRKHKPEGGSFVISGRQVFMKINDKIILVVEDDIKFELIEKKIEDKDLNWARIVKDWK